MADYYTQFSAILELHTDEQRDWVAKYLPLVTHYVDEVCGEELLAELGKGAPEEGYAALCDMLVESMLTPVDGMLIDGDLWLYSEQSGAVELAVLFAHLILERFDMDSEFFVTWSETCSSMRDGGFSGGSAIATKSGWALSNANDQFEHCREMLAKGKSAANTLG